MPEPPRVAVHATHEAAQKLGGIGAVLAGLLPEPAYQQAFARTLLVGAYLFPADGSVLDDPGFAVRFDSAMPESSDPSLAAVAEHHGVRLVHGTREVAPGCRVEMLLASPEGARQAQLDAWREAVRERFGFDLRACDDWPAVTEREDHRLERLLDPTSTRADVPDQPLRDAAGELLPGGARWVDGRAVFPPIPALDAFTGFAASNRYLLELQVHTFIAPALWAAVEVLLGEAPSGRVTLFAHDWVGVPVYWAAQLSGAPPGQSVYFAHEARIFRLLAEGALVDWADVLDQVCCHEGHDAALYPYLRRAAAAGWDLDRMFPGGGGFQTIPYHRLGREAGRFDRIVTVGRLVRDELRVALRPPDRPDIALCPNGIPSPRVTADEAWESRRRLAAVAEQATGFAPELVVTGVMRPELSKAPWRMVGLLRELAGRGRRVCCFWLSAPRPRPTAEQVARWAADYGWPLDHRPGPAGDLRAEERALWRAIERLNHDFAGTAHLLYVNQFGWGPGLLGALDPLESSFADLRRGTDVELGLSVYEPFGIAPLEPYFAGAQCLLSDACGCAHELLALGAGETVVIGRFTAHDLDPAEVDDAARRAIEERVYGELAEALGSRLPPAAGPLDESAWLARRAAQLAAVAPYREALSWRAAVERGLLPALGLA